MPPRHLLVRGDTPLLGSGEAWERGSRGGGGVARIARRRAGERGSGVLSGNGGERVPARKVGGARFAQGSAAGMRGAGLRARAVPGCHRAAAEGRGHTHPGRPGSPPPGWPRGRAAGRGAAVGLGLGAARGRRAERECPWLGGRACPSAGASTSCFSGRRRGHFAAGGGRGAELPAGREVAVPERVACWPPPGLCLRLAPLRSLASAAWSGRGGSDPRFSSLSLSALG